MTTQNAGELALAVQTARGSPAAASTQRTYLLGGTVDADVAVNANPELRTGRIGGTPWIPAVGSSGDPAIIVRPKVIGLLLYAALGSKSVAGSSDPWTHTITLATGLPWLTLWRHYGGMLDERYSDVRIGRLVISGQSGGIVSCQVSFVGAVTGYRTAQETTVAVETADPFFYRYGAGALLVEGSAFSSITTWTLTIDTGVSLIQSLAGPMPRLSGKAMISLGMTHRVIDASLWKRMVYGTSSPTNLQEPQTGPLALAGSPVGVQFTLTAATGPERSLRIALPQVALGPISGMMPMPAYGPVTISTSLLAYAPAAGSPITATLKNSQSSY